MIPSNPYLKNTYSIMLIFALMGAFLFASCGQKKNALEAEEAQQAKLDSIDQAQWQQAKNLFGMLPDAPQNIEHPMAQLGQKLFFETALSINGEMSCNSCHMLDKFGVDNLPVSPGHQGKTGDRNSPTVYNAWFHSAQFWDGRAADLKEQAKGPILNPIEMGIPNEQTAVKNIKAIKEYAQLFAAAYPAEKDPITYDNIAGAIASFEQTLRTPAPFDAYLEGDRSALNEDQKRGMATFVQSGCITCHLGPGLGGQLFQKFGLVNGPYWEYTGSKKQDKGKMEVSGNQADEFVFKVPSLRNVAKTAPYFHDGSVADLSEVIKIMGKTQLGKDLQDNEVKDIVAFLQSLTGTIPEINKLKA